MNGTCSVKVLAPLWEPSSCTLKPLALHSATDRATLEKEIFSSTMSSAKGPSSSLNNFSSRMVSGESRGAH